MKFFSLSISLVLLISLFSCKEEQQSSNSIIHEDSFIFCGTYTKKEGHVDGKAQGIHVLKQNSGGKLELINTFKGTINPSFLCISPNGKYLYAVSEIGPDVDTSAYVEAYQVKEGQLEFINKQATYGHYACHVDVSDRYLTVSNYLGGVSVYAIAENGGVGQLIKKERFDYHGKHPRQETSHPHSFTISPDYRYGYVCDLGGDRVYQFGFAQDSIDVNKLARPFTNQSREGGPRHLTFHPDGKRVFILNELENRVVLADYDAESGNIFRRSELATIPSNFMQKNTAADLHVSKDGRFLYTSNRGHGSLAIYSLENPKEMHFVDFKFLGGKTPRNFMLSKDGQFLHVALQNANAIESFKILNDGRLTNIGRIDVATPVCLIEG